MFLLVFMLNILQAPLSSKHDYIIDFIFRAMWVECRLEQEDIIPFIPFYAILNTATCRA